MIPKYREEGEDSKHGLIPSELIKQSRRERAASLSSPQASGWAACRNQTAEVKSKFQDARFFTSAI
jgi:hypothetical protein